MLSFCIQEFLETQLLDPYPVFFPLNPSLLICSTIHFKSVYSPSFSFWKINISASPAWFKIDIVYFVRLALKTNFTKTFWKKKISPYPRKSVTQDILFLKIGELCQEILWVLFKVTECNVQLAHCYRILLLFFIIYCPLCPWNLISFECLNIFQSRSCINLCHI